MIRVRLIWLKHLTLAALLLALGLAAAEIAVRASQCAPDARQTRGSTTAPSAQMHHSLQPLRNFSAGNARWRTNSFGLRGPEPAVPKPVGTYRILCLGDEATLAADVPDGETFCSRLGELLQSRTRMQIEVINAGVPGYCPLLSYLQVRHQLLGLQPDLLLLSVSPSDLDDDRTYRRETQLDARGVPLACANPLFPTAGPEHQDLAEQSHLLRFLRAQAGHYWSGRIASEQELEPAAPLEGDGVRQIHIDQALSPLVHLRDLARGTYGQFAVTVVPRAADPGPSLTEEGPRAELESLLSGYALRNAIPFCDARPAFRSTSAGDRRVGPSGARLSPEGHALYAQSLAQFLIEQIPGPWSSAHFGHGSAAVAPIIPR